MGSTGTASGEGSRPGAGGTVVDEREARRVAEAAREAGWARPSFGKELFLGRLRLDLVHPYPEPSQGEVEEGEAFLARLRDFCEREVDPLEIERDAKIPDRVVQGLKDLGAFGMKIRKEYGGLGLSTVYYNRALGLAGTWHAALSTILSAHQSIGVPEPVRHFGTEEQRRRYLPRLARSDVSAFLLTEPDVGSDPARLATTAVPVDDDSAYLLNGRKLWTTNGTVADLLVVMAAVPKSEGHRGGITAFVVESDTPGVRVLHRNQFMGLRGIENGVTEFRDVRVPAENIIGREGQGLKIALTTLNTGRLALPAICAADGKYALKIVREWASERVQWGRPIGEHEAVASKVAFIAGTAFALEAVVELASALADQARNDIRIEAALAKLWSSEMAWLVADAMVQVRGGRGFETAASLKARGERPVPAEQMLRDLRINRIFEGSSEIMRLLIAREAVDQHLAVAGDIIDPDVALSAKARSAARAGGFYARWLPTLVTGEGHRRNAYGEEFGDLAHHLRFVERASRKLARSTFYGMARWQGGLEKRQAYLGRIVDIGAELFAMSASVVRAQMLTGGDLAEGTVARELADLFCRQSRRRVDRLFHDLWHNDDAEEYAAAQRVLSGRYRFAEVGVLDPSGGGAMVPVDRQPPSARGGASAALGVAGQPGLTQ
jgi:alkylation response protein AidB-like acyl-CoA dehydrogenase